MVLMYLIDQIVHQNEKMALENVNSFNLGQFIEFKHRICRYQFYGVRKVHEKLHQRTLRIGGNRTVFFTAIC